MCELMAYSALHNRDLTQNMREFYSHCEAHPNGWGLASYDGKAFHVRKEPVKASESPLLKKILSKPFSCRLMLGHIRYATVGRTDVKNSHPFLGKDNHGRLWTFIHNGTIFHSTVLEPYEEIQKGSTDSERILLYLLDRINAAQDEKGDALSGLERAKVVEEVTEELSPGNKLNVILYDGELLYVHKNMQGALYQKRVGDGMLFATVPLDEHAWEPVPITSLQVYREGEVFYQGASHSCEYIYEPDPVAMETGYFI